MSNMKNPSGGVYISADPFPNIGENDIEFLKNITPESPRGRARICTHKTNDDRMHEMFIGFTGDNYVRPSRHIGKDESLHLLDGAGDYYFFDHKGNITDTVPLGPYSSEHQFYCRIPALQEHALVISSDKVVFHESTPGPFRREDTEFSSWSPPDEDTAAVQKWLKDLPRPNRSPRPLLKMKRTGQEVYVADEEVRSVGRKEMDLLKSEVSKTDRKRVRLCIHTDPENTLHEMFVVYMSMTYVKPNMHVNKDESLHILEGEADFIFFDDNGNIREIIPLGDRSTGRQFYVRVPQFVYHTLVMKSGTLVIHEVTPGPFRREETVWAPWAPLETDLSAVEQFMNKLKLAIAAKR